MNQRSLYFENLKSNILKPKLLSFKKKYILFQNPINTSIKEEKDQVVCCEVKKQKREDTGRC
jgi:hypothetical protein